MCATMLGKTVRRACPALQTELIDNRFVSGGLDEWDHWMNARVFKALEVWRSLSRTGVSPRGTLSLASQFLIATSAILLFGMALIGNWVASKIEESVVRNTATATALYLDNFVEPHVRELANGSTISTAHVDALNQLLLPNVLGNRIVSVNVWDARGRIVFSTRPDIIGSAAYNDLPLQAALAGHVQASLNASGFEDTGPKRDSLVPVLEICAPIRSGPHGAVIAVAEFYENGEELQQELTKAKQQSWLLVIAVTSGMLALQYGIVNAGSRTIDQQKTELIKARLLSQQLNEKFMRRIGAELHDGPAQLIGMSVLLLEPVRSGGSDRGEPQQTGVLPDEIELARDTLVDALDEIRNISAGLVLPDLDPLTLEQALDMAARTHARRTNTTVATEFIALPPQFARFSKSTLYRVAQEGLSNAFHHAGGVGQTLRAYRTGDDVVIEVLDRGQGHPQGSGRPSRRLGLAGLKDRVESLGGSLEFAPRAEGGCRLSVRVPIAIDESTHV